MFCWRERVNYLIKVKDQEVPGKYNSLTLEYEADITMTAPIENTGVVLRVRRSLLMFVLVVQNLNRNVVCRGL